MAKYASFGIYLLLLAMGLAEASVPAAAALPDYPDVRTIAGSGKGGLADGPAPRAEFVQPVGVAFDRHGNLFITDRAGQRIKKLSNRGVVSTIAGSGPLIAWGLGVQSGYRDGPASTAQFSNPSGIAIGPDDAVYVADTSNHVIRRIKDGVVSTFAGIPLTEGNSDGPRAKMTFTYPRALAFDRRGNLYVVDFPNGIRKIDPAGDGSTFTITDDPGAFKSISSITITQDAGSGEEFLLAGSVRQTLLYNLTKPRLEKIFFTSRDPASDPQNEGSELAGSPAAIAAFDRNEWLAADNFDSTVELHQGYEDYVRVLNEQPPRNASRIGGGYRDGPGRQALFSEPLGITVTPDGKSIVVADTGNRRIRMLSAFDRRASALECCSPDKRDAFLPKTPNNKEFRIALIGASYVWWDTPWGESIPGLMEKQLNSNPDLASRHLRARVYAVSLEGAGAYNILSYINNLLTTGIVNEVVAALEQTQPGQIDNTDGAFHLNGTQGRYDEHLTARIVAINKALSGSGTSFLVAPYFDWSAFPLERSYGYLPTNASTPRRSEYLLPYLPAVEQQGSLMFAAVRNAHVPISNVAQAQINEELSPFHHALFQALDPHFNSRGNALFAKVVADKIESMHPWRH